MKRIRVWAALVALALAVNVAGCAAYKEAKDPVEKAWVTVGIAKTVQKEALYVAQQPSTPPAVVDGIKRTSPLLVDAATAVATAADEYTSADAQVKALQTVGADVPVVNLQKANIAAAGLKNTILKLQPIIDQMRQHITSARKGR